MSVRYSGDAEITLGLDEARGVYRGRVVDPYLRFPPRKRPRHLTPEEYASLGEVPVNGRDPTSSDAYDDAARRLCRRAQHWAKGEGQRFMFDQDKKGRVTIRRVFQSPCPLEDL